MAITVKGLVHRRLAYPRARPCRLHTGRDGGGSKPAPSAKDERKRPGPEQVRPKDPAAPPAAVELPDGGREFALGGTVAAIAFSPAGDLLAAGVAEPPPGAADHPLGATAWDLTTGKAVRHLGRGERVPCLVFNRGPDGRGGETVALVRGGDNGPMIWFRNTDAEEKYVRDWKPDWGRATAVAAREGQSFALGYTGGMFGGRVF